LQQKEIILCTMGTRGDITPFLGLASEFIKRNFDVTVLSNENWRENSIEIGARFTAISGKDISQSGRDDQKFFADYTIPSFRSSYDYIKSRIADNIEPMLVYRSNMLGVECAAEKFCLPNFKISLQPIAIKSIDSPPWPLSEIVNDKHFSNQKSVITRGSYLIGELIRGRIFYKNRFRRDVGLPPLKLGGPGAQAEDLNLLLAPEWFAMPAADWPLNTKCIGFPYYPSQHRLDKTISGFMEAYGAPLVFTPGTGVTEVRRFFDNAVEICTACDLPGIFLSPEAYEIPANASVPILKADFAPLEEILKSAKLIVHHGGIGTTAEAIRAGIPQIIIPDRFDQPDNAVRVARLGLGAAIFDDAMSRDAWRDMVMTLTQDPKIKQRLAIASQASSRDRALVRACDYVLEYSAEGRPNETRRV
jgi:rhamnosyltransferase subunit B